MKKERRRLTEPMRELVERNTAVVGYVLQHHTPIAVRVLGYEEAESVGFLGLMHAAWKWASPLGTPFHYYAIPWVRKYVTRASQRAEARPEVQWGEDAEEPSYEEPDTWTFDAMLRGLTPRQQRVLRCLYVDGLTFHETAAAVGVSKTRVCQIRAEAIGRLRGETKKQLTMGRRVGRPDMKTDPDLLRRAAEMFDDGATTAQVADALGCGKTTVTLMKSALR
jgi:RNA polymerase sigma factor (sigma-70 family)